MGQRRALVTGGAGFIGSHLAEALVADGALVTVVDNLSSGRRAFLESVEGDVRLVEGDLATMDLASVLAGQDEVWHLAANPEVRTGETDPRGHYRENVANTFLLLEAMREAGVRKLRFTSTSTIYGRATTIPTPEEYGPLLPISIYGACKLACEALIASYAGTFGFDALNFRFANVVGPRSTHGVVYDFVHKLRKDPTRLEILGDGSQTKSYVAVADTVAGMLHAARHSPPGVHPYNIGSLDAIPVTELARAVAEAMGVQPRHEFKGGAPDGAGWVGDVKRMGLDLGRLRALGPGWSPRHTSAEAVRIAALSLL